MFSIFDEGIPPVLTLSCIAIEPACIFDKQQNNINVENFKINLVILRKLQSIFPNMSITLELIAYAPRSYLLKNFDSFYFSFPRAHKSLRSTNCPSTIWLFIYLCHHHIRHNYSYNSILLSILSDPSNKFLR